jgi:hypothetical protein
MEMVERRKTVGRDRRIWSAGGAERCNDPVRDPGVAVMAGDGCCI